MAKRTTAPYEKLTPKQKELAKELFAEMKRMYRATNRVIHDTVMVFTPNTYLIFKENYRSGGHIDQHLLDFRKILALLKISNKEAKAKDLTMNLFTGDKIRDYMIDRNRMARLKINLTKEERDFIWNYKW